MKAIASFSVAPTPGGHDSGAPDPGAGASILHGEAVDGLRALHRRDVAPDLIYVDPPFFTGRTFHAKRTLRRNTGTTVAQSVLAYDDTWEEGLDGYLGWMQTLIEASHECLRDDGSLLLHVDHRVAPYVAVLADRIFGLGDRQGTGRRPGFRNELVWTYGLGGSSARSWPRKHDTIFWYSKSGSWHFEAPRVPARSARMRGQSKKMPDVLDVPAINNMASERTGYPTQKPLSLLEMLVRAHTPEGGLVVDPCCGSGTTAVAALRAGRRTVAIDRGWEAVRTTRDRLLQQGATLSVWRGRGELQPGRLTLELESTRGAMRLRSPTLLSAAFGGLLRDGRFIATSALLEPGTGSDNVTVPADASAVWVESHDGRLARIPTTARRSRVE